MHLDGLHVLNPTQFPASFITRFTDSPLWHGNRVLTQTVWERMSMKYNRDPVAPAEFVHTVYSLFECVCACLTLLLHVSATHMQLSPECAHAHVCVNLCF